MADLRLQLAEMESDVGNMSRKCSRLVEGVAIEKSQYVDHAITFKKLLNDSSGLAAKAILTL